MLTLAAVLPVRERVARVAWDVGAGCREHLGVATSGRIPRRARVAIKGARPGHVPWGAGAPLEHRSEEGTADGQPKAARPLVENDGALEVARHPFAFSEFGAQRLARRAVAEVAPVRENARCLRRIRRAPVRARKENVSEVRAHVGLPKPAGVLAFEARVKGARVVAIVVVRRVAEPPEGDRAPKGRPAIAAERKHRETARRIPVGASPLDPEAPRD